MVTNELVNKCIDYILEHLEDEITLDEIAAYCNYSKYHFSRVFKAATGESIYALIKRLKMDQSAVRLKIEREKPITEIGYNYGYSPSNYSSAFRKHHDISPAEFRKGLSSSELPNPFTEDKSVKPLSYEEYQQKVSIEELGDLFVIYERHIGNYMELDQNWQLFLTKHKDYCTKDTLMIERSYDDPSISNIEQCIYDICITTDRNCTLDHVTTIPGGRYAVYRFAGDVRDIFITFQGLFRVWLPRSGYDMDDSFCLGIYRRIDRESMHVVMDFCIPVK